jgi:hypothetical protein
VDRFTTLVNLRKYVHVNRFSHNISGKQFALLATPLHQGIDLAHQEQAVIKGLIQFPAAALLRARPMITARFDEAPSAKRWTLGCLLPFYPERFAVSSRSAESMPAFLKSQPRREEKSNSEPGGGVCYRKISWAVICHPYFGGWGIFTSEETKQDASNKCQRSSDA